MLYVKTKSEKVSASYTVSELLRKNSWWGQLPTLLALKPSLQDSNVLWGNRNLKDDGYSDGKSGPRPSRWLNCERKAGTLQDSTVIERSGDLRKSDGI